MVAIDFATRRRVRVNGTLTALDDAGFDVEVEQAYGNCPQFIQQRHLEHTTASAKTEWSDGLRKNHVAVISQADTFFLGTVHPTRGVDSSHRGGSPGFVRADGETLWWPDFHGNNMFNSLGNLAVDHSDAPLFPDFTAGRTVQLSGTAEVEWITPGTPGDDDDTGRRIRFTPRHVVTGEVALHAVDLTPYPRNPELA
jgi:predicted pyridoxine 5'-phosphate oxidase superfamily flavin-nucleotide-binding protein